LKRVEGIPPPILKNEVSLGITDSFEAIRWLVQAVRGDRVVLFSKRRPPFRAPVVSRSRSSAETVTFRSDVVPFMLEKELTSKLNFNVFAASSMLYVPK
jgi:hypothetical protein